MGSQKQEYEWEPTKGSPSFRMSMAYLAPKYTKNLKCKQVWPTINFYCQVIESACKETDRYKGGTLPSHDSGGWWKDYFSLVGLGGMVPWLHHDLCVFVASLSHLIDTCLQLGLFSDATCYQRCQDTVHSKRCVTALVLTFSRCCSSNWSISKLQISDDGWKIPPSSRSWFYMPLTKPSISENYPCRNSLLPIVNVLKLCLCELYIDVTNLQLLSTHTLYKPSHITAFQVTNQPVRLFTLMLQMRGFTCAYEDLILSTSDRCEWEML